MIPRSFIFTAVMFAAFVFFSYNSANAQQTETTEEKKEKKIEVETEVETMEHHSEEHTDEHEGMHGESVETSDEFAAWNKVCPVMGNEVDPEVATFEYEGKAYGFCCPGCDKKFQKDPEKYSKNLSEDGSTFMGKKSGH